MGQLEKKKFPAVFWLVILFEFVERGSYYGMMSILSIYFTSQLHFPKEDVGVVKAVIQPILYFLPIVAGAVADRFGYRKALTVAFALLGTGYFLTSQATAYTPVFLSLVVMALGAGTFKPLVSGTIGRVTDSSNSTIGFGIFYWSINLGAFLFPLILVPILKNNLGWSWVMVAAAACTGIMIVPVLLFFREPPKQPSPTAAKPQNLFLTVANAFEIIYSPIVLVHRLIRKSTAWAVVVGVVSGVFFVYSWSVYRMPRETSVRLPSVAVEIGGEPVLLEIARDLSRPEHYSLGRDKESDVWRLTVYHVDSGTVSSYAPTLLEELRKRVGVDPGPAEKLPELFRRGEKKTEVRFLFLERPGDAVVRLDRVDGAVYRVVLAASSVDAATLRQAFDRLGGLPELPGLTEAQLRNGLTEAGRRPFFLLFVAVLYLSGLLVLAVKAWSDSGGALRRAAAPLLAGAGILAFLWLTPGLSTFSRGLCSVIHLTVISLFFIDMEEAGRFRDHFRFLSMIFIYSGFWILYFQMYDSVLWYLQAYVDAGPLNGAVNSLLGVLGIGYKWRFDVEHVTVLNAGTIICLQLLVSRIVQNLRALPTMVAGILFGTAGMALLAVSPNIWVFMAGNIVFSVGEMTAHPKFFSYVGQTAPKSRMAMYMGYVFLYGVIGSGIGSVLGANLYVHYVDNLNQPRTLWLIFTAIGAATVVGLLAYNHFFGGERKTKVGGEA